MANDPPDREGLHDGLIAEAMSANRSFRRSSYVAADPANELSRIPRIEVRQVAKEFRTPDGRQVEALRSVNSAVAPGEFVALLGPSGCGKSTLLNLIAGLDTPTKGDVLFNGQPRGRPDPSVAFCSQEPALFPWRTVLGNITIALEAMGISGREARQIARDATAAVGLSSFIDAYPKTLSGGMRQRAVLARAVAMRSPVLLLDEPFAALDAFSRDAMQELVLQLYVQQKFTCILVTHSIEEALFMAQRIIVMAQRPSRVITEIAVDMTYPRDFSWRTSERLVRERQNIHSLLST